MADLLLWHYAEPRVLRFYSTSQFPNLDDLRDNVNNTVNSSKSKVKLMALTGSAAVSAEPTILTAANYSSSHGNIILCLPLTELHVDIHPLSSASTASNIESLQYTATDTVLTLRQRLAKSLDVPEQFFDLMHSDCGFLVDDDLLIDACQEMKESEGAGNRQSSGVSNESARARITLETTGAETKKAISSPNSNSNRVNGAGDDVKRAMGSGETRSTNGSGKSRTAARSVDVSEAVKSTNINQHESANEHKTMLFVEQPSPTITLQVHTFWQRDYYVRIHMNVKVASITEIILSQTFSRNQATSLHEHRSLLMQTFRLETPNGTTLNNDDFLINYISNQNTGVCRLNLQQVAAKCDWTRTVVVSRENNTTELFRMSAQSNLWLIVALEAHRITHLPVDVLKLKLKSNGQITAVNLWSSISIQKSDSDVIAMLTSETHSPLLPALAAKRSPIIEVKVGVPLMPDILLHCNINETVSEVKERLVHLGVTDANQCSMFFRHVKLRNDSRLADYYTTIGDTLSFELKRVDLPVSIMVKEVTKRMAINSDITVEEFTACIRTVLTESKLLPLTTHDSQFDMLYCGRLLNPRLQVRVGSILGTNSHVFVRITQANSMHLHSHQIYIGNKNIATASFSPNNSSIKLTNAHDIRLRHGQKRLNLTLNHFFLWKYRSVIAQSSINLTLDAQKTCTNDDSDTERTVALASPHSSPRLLTRRQQNLSKLAPRTDHMFKMIDSPTTNNLHQATATELSSIKAKEQPVYHNMAANDPYLLWYWNKTL